MATVTNAIVLPGGSAPAHASVEISLVASESVNASEAGWVTATDVTILSTVRPTVTAGAWSADLTPNANIDPSGTVYRVAEYVGRDRYVHYITVGSGGGTVHDLLTDGPGDLMFASVTSAVAAHNSDVSAHTAIRVTPIRTVTASYTVVPATDEVIVADASSGAVTVTLATPSSTERNAFRVQKSDSSGNNVVVDPAGAVLINGQSSLVLSTLNDSFSVVYDSTAGAWRAL